MNIFLSCTCHPSLRKRNVFTISTFYLYLVAAPPKVEEVKKSPPTVPGRPSAYEDIPVSNIRSVIAKRLGESKVFFARAYFIYILFFCIKSIFHVLKNKFFTLYSRIYLTLTRPLTSRLTNCSRSEIN